MSEEDASQLIERAIAACKFDVQLQKELIEKIKRIAEQNPDFLRTLKSEIDSIRKGTQGRPRKTNSGALSADSPSLAFDVKQSIADTVSIWYGNRKDRKKSGEKVFNEAGEEIKEKATIEAVCRDVGESLSHGVVLNWQTVRDIYYEFHPRLKKSDFSRKKKLS